MSGSALVSMRYIEQTDHAVESLADIRQFKARSSSEQPARHGTATHHYVDLGQQADGDVASESEIETVPPRPDPAPHRPHRSSAEQSATAEPRNDEAADGPEPDSSDSSEEELASRAVGGNQLYAGHKIVHALGTPDEVSCVREGDGTRVLVPGDRDGWPTYSRHGNKTNITSTGLNCFDLSDGDIVRFLDRGDQTVAVEVVEQRATEHEAVPDGPGEVLNQYASDLGMNDLIAAAAQYDEAYLIQQRLGGSAPANASTTKELLVELGLRTPAGDVPDDIDERVAAIREVTGDA